MVSESFFGSPCSKFGADRSKLRELEIIVTKNTAYSPKTRKFGWRTYLGDQKSFGVILDELIMWALVKPEVAHALNQKSISGLVDVVHR